MNDHNLDDLIIDTHTTKHGKAKGILTIIALLIVVLIVAIILTKIILKDPNAAQTELANDTTEVISPELTLQDSTEESKADEVALSEMIESEVKAPDSEEVAKETVVIDEKKSRVPAAAPVPKAPKQETKPKQEKVQPPVQSKPAPTAKPEPKKTAAKAPVKPVVQKPVHTSKHVVPQGTYYIQVGSFSRTPVAGSRLVRAIKGNGYRYRVVTAPNGMKKIQIGPYANRAEADRAIIRIKDRINKSAFVVKP